MPDGATTDVLKRTTSRCPQCHAPVEATIHRRDDGVWMDKRCATHGAFSIRLAADPERYYLSKGASETTSCCGPSRSCGPARESDEGPPLGPTCIALVELVESCDLACPTCYADAPTGVGDDLVAPSMEELIGRVEAAIAQKGPLDILQVSGGEPTLHPDLLPFLDWAIGNEKIGYVLLNTHGARLARDPAMREGLAAVRDRHGGMGLELYVQFDGPQETGQRDLRSLDLRRQREAAIDAMGALGVPTTLAMVVNEATLAHVGDTLRFGLSRPHVRGITFQPEFATGRVRGGLGRAIPLEGVHRATPIGVSDVVDAAIAQSEGVLDARDFTPLPCGDPNCHTVGYLLRTGGGAVGLGRFVELADYQGFLADRVNFRLEDLARCGCESEPLGEILKSTELGPESPFRLFIKPFMDSATWDQDRIDRCCTHVVDEDGALTSFCAHYAAKTPALV